jgi:hypothetical protein
MAVGNRCCSWLVHDVENFEIGKATGVEGCTSAWIIKECGYSDYGVANQTKPSFGVGL